MKFNIYINQKALIELAERKWIKIDLVDWAIINWIKDFHNEPKVKKEKIDGKIFFWLAYNKLKEDLPLLNVNSKKWIANRLQKLIDLWLLEKHLNKDEWNLTYFYYTQEFFDLEREKEDIIKEKHELKEEKWLWIFKSAWEQEFNTYGTEIPKAMEQKFLRLWNEGSYNYNIIYSIIKSIILKYKKDNFKKLNLNNFSSYDDKNNKITETTEQLNQDVSSGSWQLDNSSPPTPSPLKETGAEIRNRWQGFLWIKMHKIDARKLDLIYNYCKENKLQVNKSIMKTFLKIIITITYDDIKFYLNKKYDNTNHLINTLNKFNKAS